MNSIYNKTDRYNPERTIDRMKLISIIPLDATSPNNPEQLPPSPLEIKHDSYKNTLSNVTKNIDSLITADMATETQEYNFNYDSLLKYKDSTSKQKNKHKITAYEAAFVPKRHVNPGVGTYTPVYSAILPKTPEITLKPKPKIHLPTKTQNLKDKTSSKTTELPQKAIQKRKKQRKLTDNTNQPFNGDNNEYEYEYEEVIIGPHSMSTAAVNSLYNQNIRKFEIDEKVNENSSLPVDDKRKTIEYEVYKESLKGPSISFRHDSERLFYENNSPAKHLFAFDPPKMPLPPVPDFSKQRNRDFGLLDRLQTYNESPTKDRSLNVHNMGVSDLILSLSRDYPDAPKQLDKTKPRTPSVPRIETQSSRFDSAQKNERVEFLDRISQKQNDSIKLLMTRQRERSHNNNASDKIKSMNSIIKLSHFGTTSILSRAYSKTSLSTPSKLADVKSNNNKSNQTSKSRPKSTFDLQRPRTDCLFPGGKEITPESKYPSDPIKSYKSTLPREKVTIIRSEGTRELQWHPPERPA